MPWLWCEADFPGRAHDTGAQPVPFVCWYLGLLLQLAVSKNDIEARVGGGYPVIKCACRVI